MGWSSSEAYHFRAGSLLFPVLPVTFTLGNGLTFEHSPSSHWKGVPLALIGMTSICLNTDFVNCDPAPSHRAGKWRKEEEPRRQVLGACAFSSWTFPRQVVWCPFDSLPSFFLFVKPYPLFLTDRTSPSVAGSGGICLPFCGVRVDGCSYSWYVHGFIWEWGQGTPWVERDFFKYAFLVLHLSLGMIVNLCMCVNKSIFVWPCVCVCINNRAFVLASQPLRMSVGIWSFTLYLLCAHLCIYIQAAVWLNG